MLKRSLLLLASCGLIAACGGGNGGSTAIAPVAIPTSTATTPGGSAAALQQDAAARAAARTTLTALETCYVDAQTYAGCDLTKALGGGAPPLGSGPGEVQLKLSAQTYTITAHSQSGEAFMLSGGSNGALQRTCAGSDPATDCHAGSW